MHRLGVVAVALGLVACAPTAQEAAPRAPAIAFATPPPPTAPAPTAHAEMPVAPFDRADSAVAGRDRDRAKVAPAERDTRPRVEIEAPYRIDQRVVPADRARFLEELHERERWNEGGVGELVTAPTPLAGHPLPRVIVDVVSAKGGHKASDVQREARRLLWIHVVTCYGASAYRDPTLRGDTRLRFQLSRSGKASNVRVLSSTVAEPEVGRCLAAELAKIPLPKARSGSTVVANVHVGAGDEPMAPPPDRVTPGDGAVDRDAISAAMSAHLDEIEGCYARALAYAPSLWGRLAIRVHVTRQGKVDEAFETESHFPDERVTSCALHAARAIAFPAPKGGDARFVVPLRLSPAGFVARGP
jgi:hypothetical protein